MAREIDLEGELQVERTERVSASVKSARAGDAVQRRDNAEAVEGQRRPMTQNCTVIMEN